MLVWSPSVYKNCPYQFDSETFLSGWRRIGDDLLQNDLKGYFLKVTEKLENIANCNGASIYRTAEGMFLSDDANWRTLKDAGVRTSKEPLQNYGHYNHLLLSEIDKNR